MSFKGIAKISLDVIEIYIPIITFLILFFVFLLEIIARYIFNSSIGWTYEISTMGYMWTIIFGACYTFRNHSFIKFDLLYSSFSSRFKSLSTIVGNIFLIICLIILIYPAYDYIMFLHYDTTPVLRIPLNISYFPFMIMLLLVIGHLAFDTFKEIRKILKLKSKLK